METQNQTKQDAVTQRELDAIVEQGIGADVEAIRRDMSSQFKDPYECFRELVVNSSDAGARHVTLKIWDHDEKHYDAEITDDGHGMDGRTLRGMFTLFRSSKQVSDGRRVVGQHGVGVKSLPAAGQVELEVVTSTKDEAWRAFAGSLLESKRIEIGRVEPWQQPGTRFRIRFQKRHDIDAIWTRIGRILGSYVAYLPVSITLLGPDGCEPRRFGNRHWMVSPDAISAMSRRYEFEVPGARCDAVLELCDRADEIYQGGVLISTKYRLLSHGQHGSKPLKGLRIRLESPDFELPFGRHGLRNEELLDTIGEHLRDEILPSYVQFLRRAYTSDEEDFLPVLPDQVEDLCAQLLGWGEHWAQALGDMPLFLDVRGRRLSLSELRRAVLDRGVIYLEGESASGIDYEIFDAPVLAERQPLGGLDYLRARFGECFVALSTTDLVMEAPKGVAQELTDAEQRFERYLGLHPGVRAGTALGAIDEASERRAEARITKLGRVEMSAMQTVCDEAQRAFVDLDRVTWRVSHLVQRDGVTPARTQRLLLKGKGTIVLNLHHPEVRDLLELSESDALLAGHMGLAMALTDNNAKFLDHLSPAAREDLLLADAMARSTGIESFDQARSAESPRGKAATMIRNIGQLAAGGHRSPGSFPDWMLRSDRRGQA